MDDEEIAAFHEVRREMTVRQFGRWMTNCGLIDGPIEFCDPVEIDGYGTVTIGRWGGYLIQVMPMLFNDRIVLTPETSPGIYDHGWCYDKGPAAVLAAMAWNPETQGEPIAYKKRATDGVRQPGDRADGPLSEGAIRGLALLTALDIVDATSAGSER